MWLVPVVNSINFAFSKAIKNIVMNNSSNRTPAFVLTSMRYQAAAIAATGTPESTGRSIIKFDYCLPPAVPKNSGNRNRRKKEGL